MRSGLRAGPAVRPGGTDPAADEHRGGLHESGRRYSHKVPEAEDAHAQDHLQAAEIAVRPV